MNMDRCRMLTREVCADAHVRMDANNMLAGQVLMIELQLVSIETGAAENST